LVKLADPDEDLSRGVATAVMRQRVRRIAQAVAQRSDAQAAVGTEFMERQVGVQSGHLCRVRFALGGWRGLLGHVSTVIPIDEIRRMLSSKCSVTVLFRGPLRLLSTRTLNWPRTSCRCSFDRPSFSSGRQMPRT